MRTVASPAAFAPARRPAHRRAATTAAAAYTASNRYRVVSPPALAGFQAEHAARAASAAACEGYGSYELQPLPPVEGSPEFAATVTFDSKPAYEAWMNCPQRRRSHLPAGVWQARRVALLGRASVLTRRRSTARPTSSACRRSSARS